MRPTSPLLRAVALLTLASCGGGGGDSTGPGGSSSGTAAITATIDGAAWSSSRASAAVYQGQILTFNGTDGTTTVSLVVSPVTGPGTFTLSTLNNVASNGLVVRGSQGWTSYAPGGTGTLTVTTLTTTRATGTFEFVAMPGAGTAASVGARRVTAGRFDVTF